jgi:hypothetical protein
MKKIITGITNEILNRKCGKINLYLLCGVDENK